MFATAISDTSDARMRAAFLQYQAAPEVNPQEEAQADLALDELERELAMLPTAKRKEIEGLIKTAKNLPPHMIASEAARITQMVNAEIQKTLQQTIGGAAIAAAVGSCALCEKDASRSILGDIMPVLPWLVQKAPETQQMLAV